MGGGIRQTAGRVGDLRSQPGYVRSAGDVVRKLFGTIGRAGGHRSMAKAIVPLRHWRRAYGSTLDSAIAKQVEVLFLQELYGNPQEQASIGA